jgi:hypothetical protein
MTTFAHRSASFYFTFYDCSIFPRLLSVCTTTAGAGDGATVCAAGLRVEAHQHLLSYLCSRR